MTMDMAKAEYGEAEAGMCPFYRRKLKSPAWFRCISPKHANQNYEFCGDGSDAGQFQYCSGCGRRGKNVCKYYFEPVSHENPLPERATGDHRRTAGLETNVPVQPKAAGSGIMESRERATETSVSGGRASSRYSFGKAREQNQHMCQYWRRDEEQEKAYHCDSDGNPEGPGNKFPTTGPFDSVKRFRENCRKAENGIPPCCEYFPGGGYKNHCSDNSEDQKEDHSGEITKKVVKAVAKTVVNPGGSIVEGIVTNLIDDL